MNITGWTDFNEGKNINTVLPPHNLDNTKEKEIN